ncbi:MAG: hypothetical protein ACRC16_12230 [Aeromonas salmonicida]
MDAVWTLQDAKNRFSAARRGTWVRVVLSAEAELLLQMPQDDEPFERGGLDRQRREAQGCRST